MSVECPYCKHENDVCYDDGMNCHDDSFEKKQCGDCEKNFMVSTYVSISHEGHKADCLNGGKHEWEKIHGSPKEFFTGMKRCEMCNEERCFDFEGRKKAMSQYSEDLKK